MLKLIHAHMTAHTVPQTAPISATQVQNHAGGFVFQITDMQRLRRFVRSADIVLSP